MMLPVKKLDESSMEKLKALESELGVCIVALQMMPKPASISPSQLEKLKSLEKEMDAVLMAYSC